MTHFNIPHYFPIINLKAQLKEQSSVKIPLKLKVKKVFMDTLSHSGLSESISLVLETIYDGKNKFLD